MRVYSVYARGMLKLRARNLQQEQNSSTIDEFLSASIMLTRRVIYTLQDTEFYCIRSN